MRQRASAEQPPLAAERPREQAAFRRLPHPGIVEILHATYITQTFPRHTHDQFAIGVIERGAQRFECERRGYEAAQGQIITNNPGAVHTGRALDGDGWTYRMFYLACSARAYDTHVGNIAGRSAWRARSRYPFAVPTWSRSRVGAVMRERRAIPAGIIMVVMLGVAFAALVVPPLRDRRPAEAATSQARALRAAARGHCGLLSPFLTVRLDPDGQGGFVACRGPFGVRSGGVKYRFGVTLSEVDPRAARVAWVVLLAGEAMLALLLRQMLAPHTGAGRASSRAPRSGGD